MTTPKLPSSTFKTTIGDADVTLLAEIMPNGTVPRYRVLHLIRLLLAAGYDRASIKASVGPLLHRTATRKEFIAACRAAGVEDVDIGIIDAALRKLYRTQVRDWIESVNAMQEEDTPAAALASDQDYWNAYAKKFGRALMKVRAVEWQGQMLFLVDDIAKIYGGGYETLPVSKFMQDVVKCTKNRTLTKLTYREILTASPSAESEKAGLKQGKWFVDKRSMLLILQQSRKPSALEFRNHLIDILEERQAEHRAESRSAKGTPTRDKSLAQWDTWKEWNDKVNASHIVTLGEVTSTTLGMTRREYMAKNGIEEPFRDNVDEHVLKGIVTAQAATMQYGSKLKVRGQHKVNAVARGVSRVLRRLDQDVNSLDDLERIAAEGFSRA